jgi:hypothetical protein
MDSVYEWLLAAARRPVTKVLAAALVGALFSGLIGLGESSDSSVALVYAGFGAAVGLAAGVLLTVAERRAARRQRLGIPARGCAARAAIAAVVLAFALGLLALLFGAVMAVVEAVGDFRGK